MLDRSRELAPGTERLGHAEGLARPRQLADDGEDGDREEREEEADEDEAERRRVSVGILGQPVQQAREDRPQVAERHADTREPSARLGARDVGQDRVVVDQRGLVAEIGEGKEDESRPDANQTDERGWHDAHDREDQQVGLPPAGSIAHGAERRRDDRIEQDRDAGSQREGQRPGPFAQVADRPGTHREADDGEAVDRVREVVEPPREALDGTSRPRQAAQSAPPGGRCECGHARGVGCVTRR